MITEDATTTGNRRILSKSSIRITFDPVINRGITKNLFNGRSFRTLKALMIWKSFILMKEALEILFPKSSPLSVLHQSFSDRKWNYRAEDEELSGIHQEPFCNKSATKILGSIPFWIKNRAPWPNYPKYYGNANTK